ncbi:hypothetical protein C8R44DRAFT_892411 [Mycena epipterygia]|nr:hypothetical protein C8R44DRAFT_892411 [Mycena epipterygia]
MAYQGFQFPPNFFDLPGTNIPSELSSKDTRSSNTPPAASVLSSHHDPPAPSSNPLPYLPHGAPTRPVLTPLHIPPSFTSTMRTPAFGTPYSGYNSSFTFSYLTPASRHSSEYFQQSPSSPLQHRPRYPVNLPDLVDLPPSDDEDPDDEEDVEPKASENAPPAPKNAPQTPDPNAMDVDEEPFESRHGRSSSAPPQDISQQPIDTEMSHFLIGSTSHFHTSTLPSADTSTFPSADNSSVIPNETSSNIRICSGAFVNWNIEAGSAGWTFPWHRVIQGSSTDPQTEFFRVEIDSGGVTRAFSKECTGITVTDVCSECTKIPRRLLELQSGTVKGINFDEGYSKPWS